MGTKTFRAVLGIIGFGIFVFAGIMMLKIRSQSEDSVFDLFFHACGVTCFGFATLPLILGIDWKESAPSKWGAAVFDPFSSKEPSSEE